MKIVHILLIAALSLMLAACQSPGEQVQETEFPEGDEIIVEVEDIPEMPETPEIPELEDDTPELQEEYAPEQPTSNDEPAEDIATDVVTFRIKGDNFMFSKDGVESPELRVNYGDLVRIEFTNNHGMHDWVLDEFNAATEVIGAGETNVVEFVADQRGTFEYYCSVGSHRERGMVGAFIVE